MFYPQRCCIYLQHTTDFIVAAALLPELHDEKLYNSGLRQNTLWSLNYSARSLVETLCWNKGYDFFFFNSISTFLFTFSRLGYYLKGTLSGDNAY